MGQRIDLNQDPVTCARALLGTILVRGELRARIVETEAYDGPLDPGSHAFRGPTPRSEVMFGPPGRAYIYFTYGMHWCLNIVTRSAGEGSAVLLRAAEPLTGLDVMRDRRVKSSRDEDLLSGPAKLASAFGLDGSMNGMDLFDANSELRLQDGPPPSAILVGTRIGLAQGKGDDLPWRFVDADALRWVSAKKLSLRSS
ncbi:MAG: DNA-3-methyladenine glycosylase [Fimbriimonadaceae bacterium]|nr:DNA-3-methyladenine glycosylase [Fimbriimonadaceae bacterium]